MPTDIVIPTLGESISEGVVSAWLKEEGEHVERDEPVLELETDKITMEVPAPAAGVVSHSAKQGDTVTVGAVVGSIAEGEGKPAKGGKSESKPEPKSESKSESKSDAKKTEAPKKAASGGADANGKSGGGSASTQVADAPRDAGKGESGDNDGVPATPLARKLAEEHGVRLSSISATGPGGRVREQDVLAYLQTHKGAMADNGATAQRKSPGAGAGAGGSVTPRSASPGARGVTHEKMSPLRQRIAARLVEAQHTAAMLTTFNECDMTSVMALRSAHKDAFEKKHGVKLGFMSFFVKASASALAAFPRVNSFIVEKDGGPVVESHDYCDIAIAVGTKKGLVVPVLRNCESRSFAEAESGILMLAEKARDGKLTLEDMSGGTFTISNGGVYGSMLSTPILNPPQSGILGMHNIIRRPVENPAKPGSGEVVVRPMMYLALSYDHRMVDGAEAVGFLKHIKESIENPERMLLGV